MTNPNNSLGTNGAFGGRTSVNAFNDVLATFDGAGIVSGFVVEPDTGMTVAVGGDGTTRDVAVAEDPFGNRTTVDNISGDPIPVTISTASTTTARIDSIVAYVNSPATASDTSVDNPTACGIIAVNGTSGGAPLDSAIRTAITADGGTGSTAYYIVIANVSVPANTTAITSGLISAGKSINLSAVATPGSNGLMSGADKSKLDGLGFDSWDTSVYAGDSATTTTTTKANIGSQKTTSNLKGGKYYFRLEMFNYYFSTTSYQAEIYASIDGTDYLIYTASAFGQNSTQGTVNLIKVMNLSSGTHTIQLKIRSNNSGKTVGVAQYQTYYMALYRAGA